MSCIWCMFCSVYVYFVAEVVAEEKTANQDILNLILGL